MQCQRGRRRSPAGRSCRLAIALSIGVGSVGCASATSWRTLRNVPTDAVVLPVQGRLQDGDRCGPNALAIMLGAAGKPVAESVIAKAVQNDRLNGSLNIDLLLFARAQGFPARFETGNVETLIERIRVGTPALLMMKIERRSRWFLKRERLWHYVVVYGFSRGDRAFLVHSGWGPRRVTFDEIDKPWSAAGYWMMNLGRAVTPAPITRSDALLSRSISRSPL